MGRSTKTKYYCPACNRKTLVRDSEYDYSTHRNKQGWVCTNQPPKKYAALIKLLDNGDPDNELECYEPYISHEARHGDSYEENWKEKMAAARAAEVKEVRTYLLKRPACDCKIFHDLRDAKIVDYYGILDLMIRPGELIKHHLLEGNPDINRRGLEILYSSDDMDLVRLRDDNGVAVWLYWTCTWDPNRNKSEIQWDALTHEAAAFINHRDVSLRSIFGNTIRYAVWTKKDVPSERSYRLRHVPFTGALGKKKKAELVEWAKELEANLKSYEAAAVKSETEWRAWGSQLKTGLRNRTSKVHVHHYNGKSKTATVTIRGMLTQEQVNAIAELLG